MSDTVIKIENLSKIYRLGEIGTGTLSHCLSRFFFGNLNRWWAMNPVKVLLTFFQKLSITKTGQAIRGKEDPYAKIGGVNVTSEAPLSPPKGGRKGLFSPSPGGGRGEAEYIAALQDINLEVQQGEVQVSCYA